MSSNSLRREALLFGFFAGVAGLGLWHPLLFAGTHIGDTLPTDYYHFHWNYWWIRHALTHGLPVFETNYVLAPFTTNLAYHTLTPFWYPVWALLEPLTGTFVAMNILFVLAIGLSGYAASGWLRDLHVPLSLSLAGGVLYMLTPAVLLAAFINNINYVSLFWYPALLLVWRRAAESGGYARWAWAALMGASVYAMLMTDYQHALFAAFLIVPYGMLLLIRAQTWRARAQQIAAGIAALALALLLFWLAGPLAYLLTFDRSQLSPQSIDSARGIPFPLGYVVHLSAYSRDVSLGWLALPAALILLALAAARRVHVPGRAWFWLALSLPPLLLSLGPSVTLGETVITTPYVPFHELFGGLFRSPARFSPVILLALLAFIGLALKSALPARRASRVAVGAALVLAALIDVRIFEPMPLRPVAPHYAFYEAIGRETGDPYDDMVIIEIPNAGGSGEAWVGEFPPMETQLYGMTHGKRMLNGSIARAPLSHFWYWLYDDPLLAWLGQRRYLEPEAVRARLGEVIDTWPVGYLVLHQRYPGLEAPVNVEMIGWLNAQADLICPVWVEDDAIVYRTRWHPAGCPARTPPQTGAGEYVIDIGAPDDVHYLGWGWHRAEQVGGLEVRWTGQHHPAGWDPLPSP
ncbi:glycosyltransferase family 39 protein, partial [Anaerolineae bacterium CFX9]|nr:glycosyltransferase family 39 protein [Anaerolineae bacterium CFX9]